MGDALIYLSAAILPAPYAMAAGAIGGGTGGSADLTGMGAGDDCD